MGNILNAVEDRIQNLILIAIDRIVAPEIDLAIRSINASCGRNATNLTAKSERGENIGITAPFENVSDKILNYMCYIRMTRLEIIFGTR